MRNSAPTALGNAIVSVLERLGLAKKLRRYEVLELWPSIVGERIAEVSSAERLVGGKLFVRVDKAAWRNELMFLKEELIAKINATMKEDVVTEIVFR
jgi:predicted nucleic acid-binding Zn ribbon protein